ncbi:formyl-CoA transferase [Halopseudomonas formosensis]|uniref:Formyl-CoA transferase n=1 Tax=Halopseudomonas formosensis TaxID=1002526 RepID=A0A1I6C8K6_9GAMM|nr:CoA transferase [Halopseudomonas formosensis]SFQ89499.1 formyl-CoA transferase [Halopseudomonas formosensis]
MNESTLHGLRVVSLGSGIASAAAGLQLCEAGAEVILVEPPDNPARQEQALFAVLNRGKRSVILDINEPEGQQRLERLLTSADVFIHEFSPKVAGTLGLDDAQLAQRFPVMTQRNLHTQAANCW